MKLPQHTLHVYAKACELLRAVIRAQIADTELRRQATNAAKSVCLNVAEAAGRVTRADKARAFTLPAANALKPARQWKSPGSQERRTKPPTLRSGASRVRSTRCSPLSFAANRSAGDR
jgi:hypothetical protein